MNSAHENSVRCGSGVSSTVTASTAIAIPMATGPGSGARHSSSTNSASASAATCCAWAKTDSTEPGVLLARDDPARQGQHQVIAIVPVGGEAVLGQLALDGEGALQLLRHELEGVGLEGVPVGHEDDLHGLGLADAPRAP